MTERESKISAAPDMALEQLIRRNQSTATASRTIDVPGVTKFSTAIPPPSMLLHRLFFLLIGVFLATLFFLALPASHPPPPPAHRILSQLGSEVIADEDSSYKPHPHTLMNLVGRVPLGLPQKRLRVLVTGGAGFVGSHLVDRLIDRGDGVIVVDNFFTGRKENLAHHFGNHRFELIRHDVVEPILLEVDQIYHLACPASPVHYKFNPVKTIISFFIISYYIQ